MADDADAPRSDPPAVIDQALELLVYAPLGFALEARTLLPRFVDRGRNQVALARVVGKFAVRKGREDVEAMLLEGQNQAVQLLRVAGFVPPGDDGDDGGPGGADGATVTRLPVPGAAGVVRSGAASVDRGTTPADDASAPAETVVREPAVDVDTLAIPGYDSLSASQVVPRLDSLTPDELELVRQYELTSRGRKTILSKIAHLQSA
jgi:hypothetical protein